MTLQTTFDFTGTTLRDAGLQQAVDNADRVNESWSDQAWSLFVQYLSSNKSGFTFQMEDFRTYADQNGLPQPPSKRAFGFLSLKAARHNIIYCIGTDKVTNPKAHRAIASVWKKI